MKTITLREACLKASSGPLELFDIHNNNRLIVSGNGNHILRALSGSFNSKVQPTVSDEERDTNAALLAHSFNVLPEVVEALAMVANNSRMIGRGMMKGYHDLGLISAKDMASIRYILTKANQVKLPS